MGLGAHMSRSGFRVKVVSCPPPLEPGHPPAGSKSELSHPQNSKAKGDCRKFGLFLRTFRRESESLPVCSEWAWYSLSQFGAQQAGPCSYCYLSWCLGLNSRPCNGRSKLPGRCALLAPKGPILEAPAPSVFAYTLGRLQFSDWISLIWKRVLRGKTLPSDLALIVRGLDTASLLSTP